MALNTYIGGKLGKEGYGDDGLDPGADVADHVVVLATGQPHPPLPHAMGTGQVELEGVCAGLLGHLGQLLPVLLVVGAHDAGDDQVWSPSSFEVSRQVLTKDLNLKSR